MQQKLLNFNLDHFIDLYRKNRTILSVSREVGVDRNSIYAFLHRNNVDNIKEFLRTISFNERFFENIDSEEKAYWLGFICADGYVISKLKRVGIHIHSRDKSHLIKFKHSLMSNQNVREFSKNCTCEITHHSENMVCDLRQYGVVDRKSLTLKYPRVDKIYNRHLIRGYVDGDGCITNNCNKKIRLSIIGTEHFLNKIQNIFLKELNIPKRKLQHPSRAYCLGYNGNIQASKITSWLYEDSSIFLDRKYQKYKQLVDKTF